ncbi:MAG TPA: DUF2384 domain-containing protein [Gammaproteobacteria bacterium]|nr:DUF2384 domain-containing protein [Gammaproteobacteria bacterium]
MPEPMTSERRLLLTQHIMSLLDSWGTTGQQKVVLLGLPEDIKARKLERYRSSEPFPDTDTVNEHLEHLVGIADALRTTYPRNVEMCNLWLRKPHKRFDGRTPIQVMVEDGLSGLIRVRSQLDCAFAWDNSGSV